MVKFTNLENTAHEDFIALVADFMFSQHLVDHWDEDVVLLAQLQHEGG